MSVRQHQPLSPTHHHDRFLFLVCFMDFLCLVYLAEQKKKSKVSGTIPKTQQHKFGLTHHGQDTKVKGP